jgi:hypothetical protein
MLVYRQSPPTAQAPPIFLLGGTWFAGGIPGQPEPDTPGEPVLPDDPTEPGEPAVPDQTPPVPTLKS